MQTTKMDAAALEQASAAFGAGLNETKRRLGPDFPWYPYGSLANFVHLKPILQDHPLDALVAGGPVLDIGAADGEVAFFLESLGYTVAIVDHAPTNYNSLRGARMLADHMGSSVTIADVDLDSYFELPGETYDLVFFLGILYHLKNPFYAMEHLSRRARHILVSTRVARFAPQGQPIRDIPVGYLVGPLESNNDATNFWIFSETGLKQLFTRSGWDVVSFHTVGDTATSDPARVDRDERAFALLRSRHF
jgi:SAM-dependent methyltransferase